jgi:hypothetical protein
MQKPLFGKQAFFGLGEESQEFATLYQESTKLGRAFLKALAKEGANSFNVNKSRQSLQINVFGDTWTLRCDLFKERDVWELALTCIATKPGAGPALLWKDTMTFEALGSAPQVLLKMWNRNQRKMRVTDRWVNGSLRNRVIRLAYQNPELRKHLVPLLSR